MNQITWSQRKIDIAGGGRSAPWHSAMFSQANIDSQQILISWSANNERSAHLLMKADAFHTCLFDRFDDDESTGPSTAVHYQGVIGDLEALLNTRAAIPAASLLPFPEVCKSVLNYGLIDFAAMCITSDADQQQICVAVRLAIERHEPRLLQEVQKSR